MQTYEDGDLILIRVGPLGPYDNNAYVIASNSSNDAVIVDMPYGSDRVLEAAKGRRVTAILLTHTHPDHWAEYDLVKNATGAPVLCHPAERIMPADKIDSPLADGDEIAVGGLSVRAVHTPGHTPGSTCFLAGRFLLSGDTLFPGGPGRTQSPDDLRQTIVSITQKLFALPEDTPVLPGHGGGTTIGDSMREYAVYAARDHDPSLCGDVTWDG